jgi:hypothetical protein
MTNSMKSENKLDGASNFRAWKTRIDLILAKNKVLDIVKGKIVKPEFEEGKRKGTGRTLQLWRSSKMLTSMP